jgi:TPP-dependent trihydroxycyclohexane-1,2-dione (THcHDO) dehydratase
MKRVNNRWTIVFHGNILGMGTQVCPSRHKQALPLYKRKKEKEKENKYSLSSKL